MTPGVWVAQHFGLFRALLFIGAALWWFVAYFALRPSPKELGAGLLASWVQLTLGGALDALAVRLGVWSYRPMAFSLLGVPLDLHLDWTLVWGFAFVWPYSRWRSAGLNWIAYMAAWAVGTVLLDASSRRLSGYLASEAAGWWIADAVLVVVLLGATLWVYASQLWPSPGEAALRWGARIRTTLYIGTMSAFFYLYLPWAVLSLTRGWGVTPLIGWDRWPLLLAVLLPWLGLGTWALLEFSDRGLGTPIPMDAPVRLVTTGPYAYVRNPMQIAGLGMLLPVVAAYPSPYVLLYAVDVVVASLLFNHLYEVEDLDGRFGEAYRRYRTHVRRWIPRLQPYRPAGAAYP